MTNSTQKLISILTKNKQSSKGGIISICSIHPWVLAASFEHAKDHNTLLLIESTCNQVNQEGGYTNTTPEQFFQSVKKLAEEYNLPSEQLILGGDHLGPNPWTSLPAEEAMEKAKKMVEAYVRAGYKKIHLDASMSCKSDPVPLSDEVIAERAAILCRVAEETLNEMGVSDEEKCLYIVGTEVPTPGGIQEEEELHITEAKDVETVIELTKKSFLSEGLSDVWRRVLAVVVQPGIEFGDDTIIRFDKDKSQLLSGYIDSRNDDSIIYEAHSTDYQTPEALAQVVEGHFAILKVGPQLTFAMREALFSLHYIENTLYEMGVIQSNSYFIEKVVKYVKENPVYWQKYYSGSEEEIMFAIKFSLSDRIRYYWTSQEVKKITAELINNLKNIEIPVSLISQHLPYYPVERVFDPEEVIKYNITRVLTNYTKACRV